MAFPHPKNRNTMRIFAVSQKPVDEAYGFSWFPRADDVLMKSARFTYQCKVIGAPASAISMAL